MGVPPNVVEASWQALVDALTYGLSRTAGGAAGPSRAPGGATGPGCVVRPVPESAVHAVPER